MSEKLIDLYNQIGELSAEVDRLRDENSELRDKVERLREHCDCQRHVYEHEHCNDIQITRLWATRDGKIHGWPEG